MKLSEWILLPQEVRMAGIDLTSPCVILEKRRNWTHRMNRMFTWLGIDNDIPNLIKAKIHRIHVCDHHSRGQGICCNPLHWYIGTMSENVMSLSKEKRQAGGRACAGREMTWSDKIWETRREKGS
jgi:hypothetical protein